MKWKNIDIGPGYYFITGTVVEWLPLLQRPSVRTIVCSAISAATDQSSGSIAAYVIMPDHLHMLVHLPEADSLHKFNKQWRGRSGRHVPKLLEEQGDWQTLSVLARHANGGCRYAFWKEQVRALAVWTPAKLQTFVDYIHGNPVRRGLVDDPCDWPHSSFRLYATGEQVDLRVVPWVP